MSADVAAPPSSVLRVVADRVRRRWATILALAAVWMLLWGDVSVGTLLGGVAVGAGVVTVFPQPSLPRPYTVHVGPALRLAGYFAVHVITASVQVAWLAWRPGPPPTGGVVAVHLRPAPELFMAMTAGFTSLLPGTVAVETDVENNVLYVHVLDLDGAGGPRAASAHEVSVQERVLRAFAPTSVLRRAGLTDDDGGEGEVDP